MTVSRTRIQKRATCIFCGNDHAVRYGYLMVAHGYTLAWGGQHGNCAGFNQPHLGDKAAPQILKDIIESLKERLKALPAMIEETKKLLAAVPKTDYNQRNNVARQIREYKGELSHTPDAIEETKLTLKNWKETPAYEIDLDVEEKEQREARQKAAQEKKDEKAKLKAEKEARIAAREAKAKANYVDPDQMFWRRFEINGEVVANYQDSYEDNQDRCEKIKKTIALALIDKILAGTMTFETAYWGGYKCTVRTRTEEKKGRQIVKDDWSDRNFGVYTLLEDLNTVQEFKDIREMYFAEEQAENENNRRDNGYM